MSPNFPPSSHPLKPIRLVSGSMDGMSGTNTNGNSGRVGMAAKMIGSGNGNSISRNVGGQEH